MHQLQRIIYALTFRFPSLKQYRKIFTKNYRSRGTVVYCFVTDGTYKVVQVINQKLSSTFLQQVYPAKEASNPHGFNNDVFGDAEHVGKFLVELRDQIITSPIGTSHFVSIDTHKLEIYDPISVRGAIVTQRNFEGSCLFLETCIAFSA